MKILYVEDNSFDADLTRRALRKSAPQVEMEVAGSVAEALAALKGGTAGFDLALIDLHLPDGDGLAVLSHIRRRELPLTVIMVTGQGDEDSAVAALKAGADDYIVKSNVYLGGLPQVLEDARERFQAEASRRSRPLRVLYIEPDRGEAAETVRHLARHAPHIQMEIVAGSEEALQRLPAAPPAAPGSNEASLFDVVLLDYRRGGVDALEILKEIRQGRGLDTPVVLVASQGDEEAAVQALKLGAADYLTKSPGYIFGLASTLENAFHSAQLAREQAALRASEARYRAISEITSDCAFAYRVEEEGDPSTAPARRIGMEWATSAFERITGYRLDELASWQDWRGLVLREDQLIARRSDEDLMAGRIQVVEFRILTRAGEVRWVREYSRPEMDPDTGRTTRILGALQDVTERVQAERSVQRQLHRLAALRTVDMAIAATIDLRVTLAVLLEQVTQQLNMAATDILLFNPYLQALEFGAGRGFGVRSPEGSSIRLGESLAGRVAQDRRIVHVSDLRQRDLPAEIGSPHLFNLVREGFVFYAGAPLVVKGQIKGVLEVFGRQPFEADPEWLDFLESLAGQAAIAIDNSEMFENLQRSNLELKLAYDNTLEGWVHALDLRDKETEGHTLRVAELTLELARAVGLNESELIHVRRGALLHDIGKLAIPDEILHKPGPLSPQEWEIMRRHPVYAYEMISPINYLRSALDIPYAHHERWDGSGYPRGLKGEEIPPAARIFAVVDVWDALRSDRPYRKAWDHDRSVEHLRQQRGQAFEPKVVEAFLRMIEE